MWTVWDFTEHFKLAEACAAWYFPSIYYLQVSPLRFPMNKNARLKGWILSRSFSFRGTEIKLKKKKRGSSLFWWTLVNILGSYLKTDYVFRNVSLHSLQRKVQKMGKEGKNTNLCEDQEQRRCHGRDRECQQWLEETGESVVTVTEPMGRETLQHLRRFRKAHLLWASAKLLDACAQMPSSTEAPWNPNNRMA